MIATTFANGISPWSKPTEDVEKSIIDLLLARPGANVPALALVTHRPEHQLRTILRDMYEAGKVTREKMHGYYRYWIKSD